MKDLNKLAGLMCQYYDVTGELKTSPIMKACPRDGKVCTLWDMYINLDEIVRLGMSVTIIRFNENPDNTMMLDTQKAEKLLRNWKKRHGLRYTYEEGEDNEYLVRRITSEKDGAQAIMSTSIVWL